jgi:polysaccharide biosynthesis protein PslH
MNLIFLCHRFPFPPDKGEKIRAYHMLVHLAQQHTVHLGAFVEDHTEIRHLGSWRDIIRGECYVEPLGAVALGLVLPKQQVGRMGRSYIVDT